jgi:hypothetical protein
MSNGSKLTVEDAVNIGMILSAAGRTGKVARLVEGVVWYGTARNVGDQSGCRVDDDVRDQYLRVTLSSGFEAFWKVSDLIPEVSTGEFSTDYDW